MPRWAKIYLETGKRPIPPHCFFYTVFTSPSLPGSMDAYQPDILRCSPLRETPVPIERSEECMYRGKQPHCQWYTRLKLHLHWRRQPICQGGTTKLVFHLMPSYVGRVPVTDDLSTGEVAHTGPLACQGKQCWQFFFKHTSMLPWQTP